MLLEKTIRRVGRVLLAHVVHGLVLLAPSLATTGLLGMGWATGCFGLAIVTTGVLEALAVGQRFDASEAAVHDKLAMRVAQSVGACLLALFWLAQIEQLCRTGAHFGMQLAGASFLAIGVVLRIQAIRVLGTQFVSDIRVGELMVREGIYAWLRHPSEIGLLLIAIGGPLLISAPLTASLGAIVLLPTSLWRMRRENLVWNRAVLEEGN